MSKRLWTYLRSRVKIIKTDGTVLTGVVTDFIDEMDNGEQDEIMLFIDGQNPYKMNEIGLLEDEISNITLLTDNVIALGEDVFENWLKLGRPTKIEYSN